MGCWQCGRCNKSHLQSVRLSALIGPPYPRHLVILGDDGCQVLGLADKVAHISVLARDVAELLPLAATLGERENIDLIASVRNPLAPSSADVVYVADAADWDLSWLPRISNWLRIGGQLLLSGTFQQGKSEPDLTACTWFDWQEKLAANGLKAEFLHYHILSESYDSSGCNEYTKFQAVVKAIKEELPDVDR